MKINFQKMLATVSAVAVMSCFAIPTFATNQPDMDEITDSYVDVSPDDFVDDDEEEPLEWTNAVATSYALSFLDETFSPFIESGILIFCVVGGFTLGIRFLKKSFL